MVDAATQYAHRDTDSTTRTTGPCTHGRLTRRLGRSHGGNKRERRGNVATTPEAPPHQLVRNESHPFDYTTLERHLSGEDSARRVRQHNYSLLPQQAGGDTLQAIVSSGIQDLDPLRQPEHLHAGPAHPGEKECPSGSSVERRPSHLDRMGAKRGGLSTNPDHLGHTSSRPVRDQGKPSAPDVRVSHTRHSSLRGRRNDHVVGKTLGVRVPAVCTHPSGTTEDAPGQGKPDPHRTLLARDKMVRPTSGLRNRLPEATSSTSRPTSTGVDITLQPQQLVTSRVSAIRSALTREGFSESVASRAAQPQRESTLAIYESKWRAFLSWCHSRQVDPVSASAAEVADFLLHLSTEKKLRLSTIEGYRMAIASVLRTSCGTEVGRSDTLRSLMKSIALSDIREQSSVPDWDLLIVLDRLRQSPFEPLHLATPKLLTWKTLFLVALASGKRRGEIHALSYKKFMHKENWSCVTFSVVASFIAKTQILERGAKSLLSFEIKSMSSLLGSDFEEDQLLCPVRAIRIYLRRTKHLRVNQKLFFISPHSGFKEDIKPATISAWLRKTIGLCYELNQSKLARSVKAHSVRSQAVSWAFRHQASLEQILAAGTWRNSSTFTSHYLKDISSTSASGMRLTPFIAAGRAIEEST